MTPISDEKRSLFRSYASECERDYLLEPAGQRHLAMYKKERKEVTKVWAQIKRAKRSRKRITHLILEKLLPYTNTRHNREKGYRIGVAPVIIKDIRKWFEKAKWQKYDNWDNVAIAIFELVHDLVDNDNAASLVTFEKNKNVSRGIKAGFVSSVLYFLNPKYRIVNNKTIDTVNFLLGRNAISRDLSNYLDNVKTIDQALKELGMRLLADKDVFDAFCHWMCAKRLGGYARFEKKATEAEEEEGPTAVDEEETEPQTHWEAIYYLVKAGNLLDFKTYVADPAKKAFSKKLREVATLTEVPAILKTAPGISKVDVIWYRPTPPFYLFEVEDGGTMRDSLHRLYNAMAFDARFFVVSPLGKRAKFEKWLGTAPYKEFEGSYNFRTYSELFDFYKRVKEFTSTHKRFLKL